jgi:hypothetical protein
VGAQDDNTIAFSERSIEVLAAGERNSRAPLLLGRFQCNDHFDAGTKEVTQGAPRNSAGSAGVARA